MPAETRNKREYTQANTADNGAEKQHSGTSCLRKLLHVLYAFIDTMFTKLERKFHWNQKRERAFHAVTLKRHVKKV
ncbi:hypothetical protein CMK19_01030 [Candidatus Poribacteria bacterium]|jgi:hypothetical protein|nr:hypothetical protein [Candidatus Poribacteria bacterium]